ncbi:hypothetical protein LCGC14_2126710 [marine sediment metagenome]|uniref:DUF1643 domain-containing protein n=1 Tax=marine sediment metagenome TaxID=412755 RepID=A0A0F9E2Q2_9ZZZZ
MGIISVGNLNDFSGAEFSACGKYRYKLWRMWERSKPAVLFVMLNPSTANRTTNDPTIRRCIRFAQLWGYGRLLICNLFAFRSTAPDNLLVVDDPTGPANMDTIAAVAKSADYIVLAWGNPHRKLLLRAQLLSNKLCATYTCYCLGTTEAGHPRHPLYMPYTAQPQAWLGYEAQKNSSTP